MAYKINTVRPLIPQLTAMLPAETVVDLTKFHNKSISSANDVLPSLWFLTNVKRRIIQQLSLAQILLAPLQTYLTTATTSTREIAKKVFESLRQQLTVIESAKPAELMDLWKKLDKFLYANRHMAMTNASLAYVAALDATASNIQSYHEAQQTLTYSLR